MVRNKTTFYRNFMIFMYFHFHAQIRISNFECGFIYVCSKLMTHILSIRFTSQQNSNDYILLDFISSIFINMNSSNHYHQI